MKKIHHLWLTVYIKPEDDQEDIISNLRKFFPFDLEKEKLKIESKVATSFEERKITILHVHLKKASHINQFLKHLLLILNQDQKDLMKRQKRSRLDADNHFFIRFDKEKLLSEGQFFITDSGNCFHLKMTIAAFPTTRENALRIIDAIFQ
ncbi:hypothetical protein GOV09_03050 [Candidatus Woesearchaeota archaeon]|nr:hypothetical protein [Candidatus Woesearchaeota archaeon]